MTFGEDWGWERLEKRVTASLTLRHRGWQFYRHSCNYTEGTSEKFVGEFIASSGLFRRSHQIRLRPRSANQDDPNAAQRRKNMLRSVEASLKRLNTDFIDLLYLHMWDYTTPVEEVCGRWMTWCGLASC